VATSGYALRMVKESLWWRRGLLKIPKNYMGFKAERNVFAEHVRRRAEQKGPAGLTASLRGAPLLRRLCGRRSDERGTGRRQVAEQQRFLGW